VIEDTAVAPLLTPDVLTTSQWRDIYRSTNGPDAGIKHLMFALLEISLRDATGTRYSRNAHRRFNLPPKLRARYDRQRNQLATEQSRDALGWIFDDDSEGVFSFVNVCDVLGIDGERLRARIRGQSTNKLAA
jgi:hypothetical protein